MGEVNLWCETENCENPAIVFGMKGNEKTRSCETHIAQLAAKKMKIFDISGYNFILNLQDVVVLEERESLVQKGRENLAMLETTCQLELSAAIVAIDEEKGKVLKAVESRFEEMKAAVTDACAKTMSQLSQLKTNLELLLISKESQLSSTAQLVCLNLNATPRFFRFGIADVSDGVSTVLSDSWTVATPDIHSTLKSFDAGQKKATIEQTLVEAVDQAKKGILEAMQYADSMIGDEDSFEDGKGKVLSEFLKQNKMRITQNEKWLQRFWSLRQQCTVSTLATVEVGKQLASIFYHQFGRFSEAEEILRYCYDIAVQQSPKSEHSMQLCNEICGVYFATERHQEVENLGKWMLETFGAANFPSEHYWTTLLYISYSMSEMSKDNEAKAIIENWRKRGAPEESYLGEMMRLVACEIGASPAEAGRGLQRAKRIGLSRFPTSPFTAFALFHLSTIVDARGEDCLLQAQSIYEEASPKTAQAAMNLSKLGNLKKSANQMREAEQFYRQAQSIYEVTSSKSYNAAVNFIELGDLFSTTKCWDEAGECCRQAQSIVQEAGPHLGTRFANIIGKLADLSARSAPPPVQEERKQPAAKPTRQALFRFTLDEDGDGDGRLEVLNVETKAWGPPLTPSQQMTVDAYTSYAFLSDTAVVACGSTLHTGLEEREDHAAGTAAYRLEFQGPTVTTLLSFPRRRVLSGIYAENENAFAFGGVS